MSEMQADVNTEVVDPSVDQFPSSEQESYQDQPYEEAPEKGQSDAEKNWEALRTKAEQLEQRLEEEARARALSDARSEQYEQLLTEKLPQILQQQKPSEPEEADEWETLDEEDWLTKKALQSKLPKEVQSIVQNALAEDRKSQEEKRRKEEIAKLPDRLKKDFADFDTVVSKENVEKFRAKKPHLAAALRSAAEDPYEQAVSVYEAIKAFGIVEEADEKVQKLERNASRPGTMGAAQATNPLAAINAADRKLTPEVRQKLHADMIAAMKG